MDNFTHLVGIDWGSVLHEVCVLDAGGDRVGGRSFRHSGDGLGGLCNWLLSISDARSMAVAIEVPHGAVVETLLERGFAVFAINPKQLDRFRDRFTMCGAKDDRRDAFVLAGSLRTDAPLFRRLAQQPGDVIELREWSRIHEELQRERLAVADQLRAQFMRFFPAFLEVAPDPAHDWAIGLFTTIPDQATALSVEPVRIAKLMQDHRIRRISPEEVIAKLRAAPVYSAPGTATAASSHARLLGERARLLNRQLRECRKQLHAALERLTECEDSGNENEQRDAAIIQTLPGVGVIVAAALLGEAAELLRRRDYQALRALTGVAPVTKQSGKRCVVIRRTAHHPRLHNALFHWARVAAMRDPAAKSRYSALRARGKSHGQALRSVGDRLLRILCAMLKSQTPYRPPELPAAV